MYKLSKGDWDDESIFTLKYGYCGCCVQTKVSAPENWQEMEDVDLIEEKDIELMEKFFNKQLDLLKQLKEAKK